jgi:hypothetical protein
MGDIYTVPSFCDSQRSSEANPQEVCQHKFRTEIVCFVAGFQIMDDEAMTTRCRYQQHSGSLGTCTPDICLVDVNSLQLSRAFAKVASWRHFEPRD